MFHNKNKKTRGTDNILLSLDNHFETMSPISLLLTTKQPYQSYDRLKVTHVKCPISLTTFTRSLRDESLEFQTFMVEAQQDKFGCGFRARGHRKKKKKRRNGGQRGRWGHGAHSYWTRRFNFRRRKGGSSGFVSVRRTRKKSTLGASRSVKRERFETLLPRRILVYP